MHTHTFLAAATLTAASAASVPAHAALLAGFDFENDTGEFETTADPLAASITGTAWSDLDGTLVDFSGDPGRSIGARDFADGNALILELSVAPGIALTLDALQFDQRASASGPTALTIAVDGAVLAGAATTAAFSQVTADLAGTIVTGFAEIVIAGSGASSSAGTFRIDNLALTGTAAPVPLPGSALLLAPAAATLMTRRIRRR